MPAYTTQDALILRFTVEELKATAGRGEDGEIDAAVVTKAIVDATSTVDSYIGARYALPLATVPDQIKSAAEDLARYQLYTVECPTLVKERRDQAIAWLKDISAGKATLGVPTLAPAEAAQSGTDIRFCPGDRRTSRAELRKL